MGAALLLAVTLLAYRTPAPLGIDAPAERFSAARAAVLLQQLAGSGVPHPIGSPANAVFRAAIVEQLTTLGYSTQLQSGFTCNPRGECGTPTNIIATLGSAAGGLEPGNAVLLAAHYDSVPSGPGASDDGAGVVSVLEIARILAASPQLKHPVVLLLTDGEEAGLLGAVLFVREHPLSSRIWAAVNLDARGTSGLSLMFETGSANNWLMHLYAGVTREPVTDSLYYQVYRSLHNGTDFTVFKGAAYQGFNLAFIGDVARYHTPLDTVENADLGSIQHQGDNALDALRALAGSAQVHPAEAESVFSDVFAHALIVWPSAAALPAALAALALLVAQTVLLWRRGTVTGRALLWGAVGTLANLALGAVLGVVPIALLLGAGKLAPLDSAPWIAHPLPMTIGASALPWGTAALVSLWLAPRAGFWGFWLATSLLLAALGVAIAAGTPGASFAFLLGAWAAALAPLPYLWLTPSNSRMSPDSPDSSDSPASRAIPGTAAQQGAADFAALLPLMVLLAALLPMLLLLYPALGALAWPLSTASSCVATGALLPLLANAELRARRGLAGLAALLTLGGILITLLLPTYSARWPQRVNIEYWLNADHSAHWWVQAASMRLPAAVQSAARFDALPAAHYPGSGSLGYAATAPVLDLAAPELAVLAATPAPNAKTHYELRLRSLRGANTAVVVFPAAAAVGEIMVGTPSGASAVTLQRLASGATRLKVTAIPPGGADFALNAGPGATSLLVFDESDGLPQHLPAGYALQQARPQDATSSQDGDATMVQRTVVLLPATGR
jgi:hypothetical protein